MKRKWKWLVGIVVIGIITTVIIMNMQKGLEASVVKIQPQMISKTFTEEGKTVSEQYQPIIPTISGKLITLPVEEGEIVKKGTVLAVIDVKELQFQLEQLKGELKSLKGEENKSFEEQYASQISQQKLQVNQALEDLKQAKTELNRMEQLYQVSAISKSEYEAAKYSVVSAENTLKQHEETLASLYNAKNDSMQFYQGRKEAIQSQIASIEHQIGKKRLIAPFDGIISNLTVKEGMVVGPQTTLMTIFKQDDYTVETYVLTEDISDVQKGLQVDIIQDTEEKDVKFQGIVEKIAPTAVEKQSALGLIEQRVKVSIRPDIPANIKLAPGYAFDIEFTTAKRENQLIVPKTTLFPYEKSEAVWVVRENKAQVQPVQKGFENDQDVAITEGLKKGDFVILNPQLEGLEEGKEIIKIQ